MTILGRIMVLAVLMFSMITGGLIVKVYLTRTNWKMGFDDAVTQGQTLAAALKAEKENARRLVEEREVQIADLKKLVAAGQTEARGLKVQISELEKQRAEQVAKANSEVANQEAATRQNDQLKRERDLDKQRINEAQTRIVRMEKDMVDFRNRAVQAEIEKDAAVTRNQSLLLKVEQQARELGQYKVAGIQPPGAAKRPPAVEVRGRVEAVAGSLAEITLGKDHGLTKDDELQVYRLLPQPQYLGTLRLTNLEEHKSVGIFSPASTKSTIMKGDTVDTKVLAR